MSGTATPSRFGRLRFVIPGLIFFCSPLFLRHFFSPTTTPQESLLGDAGGACWKGTSLHEMERLNDLQSTYTVNEFLEGPGLNASIAASDNRVAFKFVTDDHTPHFAHTMQQIYRAISWYFSNENKEPYIIIDVKQPLDSPFAQGMRDVLTIALKVKLVRFRVDLKVVRGIQSYDWDERHSFAMRGVEDAQKLRKIALEHYQIPDRNAPSCRAPRIGILNRKKTRVLQNIGRLVNTLESTFHGGSKNNGAPDATIKVISFEDLPFKGQLEFLSDTDILLTPHGAALTGLTFMPHCAQVLELFPLGYLQPAFYGSLAAVSGIGHSYIYLGSHSTRDPDAHRAELIEHMATLESRDAARASSLCPDPEVIQRSIVELVHQWQTCFCPDATTANGDSSAP